MDIRFVCPTLEDLEYYIQAKKLQPESEEIQRLQRHLTTCVSCQNYVKQWETNLKKSQETLSCQAPALSFSKETTKIYKKAEYQKLSKNMPQIIAGCHILEKIGEGSLGEVYRALKQSLRRIVAIKRLHATHEGLAQPERFEQEALLLAQVEHPNIIQIYDYFVSEDQSSYYLIMQYVDGMNLKEFIQKKGPLSLEKALYIWLQLLEGLQTLHEKNIFHRDIKPENILIDSQYQVKITDFGLAKSLDSSKDLTDRHTFLGTPYYISPEACKGAPYSTSSDIYSLGGVFYYSLLGKPPFESDSIPELLYKNLYDYPLPLSSLLSYIPPDLDYLLGKMFHKSPEYRFSSPAEAYYALIQFALAYQIPLPPRFYTPSSSLNTSFSPYYSSHYPPSSTFFPPPPPVPSSQTPSSYALIPLEENTSPSSSQKTSGKTSEIPLAPEKANLPPGEWEQFFTSVHSKAKKATQRLEALDQEDTVHITLHSSPLGVPLGAFHSDSERPTIRMDRPPSTLQKTEKQSKKKLETPPLSPYKLRQI
jgi:serine/threonine protein kinase